MEVAISRLLLRQLTPADVTSSYVRWLNDPKTNRFLEIRHSTPFTREDVVDFVASCLRDHRHHFGIFLDGVHVGNVSLSIYDVRYRWADISFLIGDEECRGKNVGHLSVATVIDYLFRVKKLNRIQAGMYIDNLPSIALVTSLGFKKEGVLREAAKVGGNYVDILKFGLLKAEWIDPVEVAMLEPPPWESGDKLDRSSKAAGTGAH